MFKLEKDMIPVLERQLSEKYQTEFYINEFDSGNGIADLVFAKGISVDFDKNTFMDYELIYVIINYLNRKNEVVEIEKFYKNIFLSKKQVLKLIDLLVEMDILEKINDNIFIVRSKYSPPVKEIISIEAKLCDWKNGFYQALRYKAYSHKSYLAISNEFVHKVDINLLKKHNIGLIAVDRKEVRFIFEAKNEIPNSRIAHAYLAQKIAYLYTLE